MSACLLELNRPTTLRSFSQGPEWPREVELTASNVMPDPASGYVLYGLRVTSISRDSTTHIFRLYSRLNERIRVPEDRRVAGPSEKRV